MIINIQARRTPVRLTMDQLHDLEDRSRQTTPWGFYFVRVMIVKLYGELLFDTRYGFGCNFWNREGRKQQVTPTHIIVGVSVLVVVANKVDTATWAPPWTLIVIIIIVIIIIMSIIIIIIIITTVISLCCVLLLLLLSLILSLQRERSARMSLQQRARVFQKVPRRSRLDSTAHCHCNKNTYCLYGFLNNMEI